MSVVPPGARSTARYVLGVAGIRVAVESASGALRLDVPPSSVAFLSDDGAPDLVLRVDWRALGAEPEGHLLFESGGVWRLFATPTAHVYRCHLPGQALQPYKELRLPLDGGPGELLLDPRCFDTGRPVDALEFPLDELLFLRLLAERGAVELHAAGVVAPSGRGYLFAGQSGDGKTTLARLWQELAGAAVLSDDRVVLRRGADGAWSMHGTPWHGEAELASSAAAPLAAILLLARGPRQALLEMRPAEAVAALLARSFVPFHDSAAMERALTLLDDVVGSVPCRRFAFVPDASAVRFVLESLPGATALAQADGDWE